MAPLVGLTYDLRDDYLDEGYTDVEVAEFDSRATIDALDTSIRALGYETERIGSVRALVVALAGGRRWDLVFNIAEGLQGRCREAQVPALLEAYGVPYTFSDPLTAALTLDKALAKRLVTSAGLPTPPFALLRNLEETQRLGLRYPLFVKPNAEGTGKGIDGRSVVTTPAELREVAAALLADCAQPLLVEEFLPGREFTVGILGTAEAARALGTMEIKVPGDRWGIYSLPVKENCEEYVHYSRLGDGPLRQAVQDLAIASYRLLDCRDAGRVDIRLDRNDAPCFLEINPLPGLHPNHSDLPMIATRENMPYRDLIGNIIGHALDRNAAAGGTRRPGAPLQELCRV